MMKKRGKVKRTTHKKKSDIRKWSPNKKRDKIRKKFSHQNENMSTGNMSRKSQLFDAKGLYQQISNKEMRNDNGSAKDATGLDNKSLSQT